MLVMHAVNIDVTSTIEDIVRDIDKEGLVLVEFYTPTCGRCKMQDKIFKDANNKGTVVKIDAVKHRKLALHHKVLSAPTSFIFKEGKEIKRLEFITKKDLEEL